MLTLQKHSNIYKVNKARASAKGLSPRQQHALKGAAQIMGNDENYFVDMYGKLDNARKNWSKTSDYFSQLGIKDIQSLEDIKDPRELIHKVVSEIQKNKKEGKLDFKGNAKMIDESLQNLLGINLQEALSIDVKDFNAKYKDSFNNVTDEELKRMGKMGSEFTSLFQTIKNFALSVTSNLAPALSKLFKAVKEGLANFKNSDTFKSIMDSMRKFFDSASGKASGAIKSFFDNLPNLVKQMQGAVYGLFEFINRSLSKVTFGDTSTAYEMRADYYQEQQNNIYFDMYREKALKDLKSNNSLDVDTKTYLLFNEDFRKRLAKDINISERSLYNHARYGQPIQVNVQVNNTQNAEAQINSTANAQIVKATQIGGNAAR